MSNTYYEKYRDNVIALARTMIVKHTEYADSINNVLRKEGSFSDLDTTNPYYWKYYLNLAGDYHKTDHESLMLTHGTPYMVIKVATDEGPKEVPFVKELIHGDNADISIANEYQVGTRLYQQLVDKYPEHEMLISGILNPIDIDTAIKAKNGEILYIDGHYKQFLDNGEGIWTTRVGMATNRYIEPQEHNLVEELQRYIYNFEKNWSNGEYIVGNDLYAAVTMGILYLQIPNVIMNIRLGNCRTIYAHSFHVREYLESFGQLGRYVGFIPLESALWLYRNDLYLDANRGKQANFHNVIDNIFTPNRVPIVAWSMRHNISQMGYDKSYLPKGMYYKEPINFEIDGISDDDRTVRDILNDQVPLARDNKENLDLKEAYIQNKLDWAGDDRLQTKVLESEMMEFGEPYPFTRLQFLLNHWGYTASRGWYTGTLYVSHPVSGERISITPLNAYKLALYCLNYGLAGKKFERVPLVHFYKIPRTNNEEHYPTNPIFEPKPSVDKAMGWVTKNTRRQKIAEVLGTHEPKFKANTPQIFAQNVEEIFQERVRKYYAYCNTEDLLERGDLELVAKRSYWFDFEEDIGDEVYSEWFKKIGVNLEGVIREDILKLGLELVAIACNLDTEQSSRRRWLQHALIQILKHFTSYTIHFIEKFAEGTSVYLEGKTIRFSNFQWRFTKIRPAIWKLNVDVRYGVKIKLPVDIPIKNIFETVLVSMAPNLRVPYRIHALDVKIGKGKRRLYPYNLTGGIYSFDINEITKEFKPILNGPVEFSDIESDVVKDRTNFVLRNIEEGLSFGITNNMVTGYLRNVVPNVTDNAKYGINRNVGVTGSLINTVPWADDHAVFKLDTKKGITGDYKMVAHPTDNDTVVYGVNKSTVTGDLVNNTPSVTDGFAFRTNSTMVNGGLRIVSPTVQDIVEFQTPSVAGALGLFNDGGMLDYVYARPTKGMSFVINKVQITEYNHIDELHATPAFKVNFTVNKVTITEYNHIDELQATPATNVKFTINKNSVTDVIVDS